MKNKDSFSLFISEKSPEFEHIENALIEKIYHEAKKIIPKNPEKILEMYASYIADILDAHNISYTLEKRTKEHESIVNKVIRKLHKIITITPDTALKDMLNAIGTTSIKKQINDLFALRIVVNSPEDCYRVFHRLSQNLNFAKLINSLDFIAFPKENNYQAIHMNCQDTKKRFFFEIQIVDKHMYKNNTTGTASRKKYAKEKGYSTFRNIALVALAVAATTGTLFYTLSKRKQSKD